MIELDVRTTRTLFLVFLAICFALQIRTASGDVSDLSDIPSDKQQLFFLKTPLGSPVDSRIKERLITKGALIRSYAVVIAISEYPRFKKGSQHLQAAADDLDNLKIFLKKQAFDEIIILSNADATKENIDYVLSDYLPHQLDTYGDGARVLIAYSGHGANGADQDQPGFFVLSNAKDGNDYANLYSLSDFETKLKSLAVKSFQLLALVNSCNSGGLFYQQVSSGGNDTSPGDKGAHAITASKPDELAYSFPGTSGSIFFNAIIEGVDSGKADPNAVTWVNLPDGTFKRLDGGIVRFGFLANYLSNEVDNLGLNPATGKPYSQPMWGSIMPRDRSLGAFFFLGPSLKSLATAINLPASTDLQIAGSGIVGLPGYKIFRPPDTYEILGVDVSSWNKQIDWAAAARNPKLKFVYIRANSSRWSDDYFDRNWRGVNQAGLKYGAYYVFDVRTTAEQQLSIIKQIVPLDKGALPIAIDPEMFQRGTITEENKNKAVQEFVKLKKLCSDYYGKPAIVYGSSSFFSDLPQTIKTGDSIWLANYSAYNSKAGFAHPPVLAGKEPWTIWQFTGDARLDGINTPIDINAFFGTKEDFEAYAKGDFGVASKYVLTNGKL